MKLAISNIAWEVHNDMSLLAELSKLGVQGIEVAPSKIWPQWQGATEAAAQQYRKFMQEHGFTIPSMQAILFGKPELQVFDKTTHAAFLEHVKLLADIAAALGAKVLVFGAPKNRKRGQLSIQDAMAQASDLLRRMGEICHANGCCIGLEANPAEYACDFITNVADARQLVDMIDHPGVQLHLDVAGMHMCGGNVAEVIQSAGEICHFHISEPMLAPIADGVVDHASAAAALKASAYPHWLSIEMKQVEPQSLLLDSVKQAINAYQCCFDA